MRLLGSSLSIEDIRPRIHDLVNQLFAGIPSGVGKSGTFTLSPHQLEDVLQKGSAWAVDQGFGSAADLDHTEERGCIARADPGAVSDRARQRGIGQLGTLGSGNHFLEIQQVDEVFDPVISASYNLVRGRIVVLIHTGSRGLGHQVCTDYVGRMDHAMERFGIRVPDRQLACAPIASKEGTDYFGAMSAAANFAWANRQCITHATREAFRKVFGPVAMPLIYDVAHNIAKRERHRVGRNEMDVLVHRKGATRAFPNQPVFIPGSMGTASYFLVGRPGAMLETFGSACHGAGRVLSRTASRRGASAREIQAALQSRGIIVRSLTKEGLTEEKPEAYKDIESVVDVVEGAGIAGRVARLKPVGVIKG